MSDKVDPELSHFCVSPEAKLALDRIRSNFKNIMFHITLGCCDVRSPVCLEAGELRLGCRDYLVGFADGVPVYEMTLGDRRPEARDYILDVMPGTSVGFSLDAGTGLRFTLREARATYFWETKETSVSGVRQ